MPEIVTLTMNPAVDVSVSTDRVVPEDKLRCTAPRLDPGGGGLNVARVIHELGGNALALYLAGGATGILLRELVDEAGIHHEPLPICGAQFLPRPGSPRRARLDRILEELQSR